LSTANASKQFSFSVGQTPKISILLLCFKTSYFFYLQFLFF
jgi:hypothetical protein